METYDRIWSEAARRRGEEFANRMMKHLDWIIDYPEHGAPGHLDYMLIKTLFDVINKNK
jgi:hypothetical protein